MRILLMTPAHAGSTAGNRATAERWQNLLQQAGHSVDIVTEYHGDPCDAFIALHAWRSVDAIRRFRSSWPEKPLIVALTGTDIYRHQYEYPEDTRYSMEAANVLIGLHSLVANDIPVGLASKLVTLYQSSDSPEVLCDTHLDVQKGGFGVCVIGHLREEKDSLRAAYAARLLPQNSRIQVVCAGRAHDEDWHALAEEEMATNPRYQWVGELNKRETRQLMANSQVMVISSVMEGGANVVSEACRARLPVIASDISGNVGLLGEGYAGYFPVGNERALADLLYKAEQDPEFLDTLKNQVSQLARHFLPETEQASLEQALDLAVQRCSGRH